MATKLETLETELATVRTAMNAIIEGGQSVSVGDVTYTEVSFAALAFREKDLSRKISRLNGSRPAVLPVNLGSVRR